MRKIIHSAWITLDGFVSGPEDGRMGWLRGDDQMMEYEQSLVDGADILLLGRKTFNDFVAYWPDVARSASPDGTPLPRADQLQRAYARRLDAMKKCVVSASGAVAEWRNSQRLSGVDRGEIGDLKRSPGKDVVIYGSLTVVEALAKLGLMDEYHLLLHPAFIGTGRPMFQSSFPVDLDLLSVEAFASGVVVMKYRPAC